MSIVLYNVHHAQLFLFFLIVWYKKSISCVVPLTHILVFFSGCYQQFRDNGQYWIRPGGTQARERSRWKSILRPGGGMVETCSFPNHETMYSKQNK